jgi:hypothetical protein
MDFTIHKTFFYNIQIELVGCCIGVRALLHDGLACAD